MSRIDIAERAYKIEIVDTTVVWGLTVPEGIQRDIEVHLWGAGGGGGGDDAARTGGNGAGGQYQRVLLSVNAGDVLAIAIGRYGSAGGTQRTSSGRGAAGSSLYLNTAGEQTSFSGGAGANAGTRGSSGAGGGGGGATVLMLNGTVIATAGGGGGGGGAGLNSNGGTANGVPRVGTGTVKGLGNGVTINAYTNGQEGQALSGDGAGAGGGGGGIYGGDGGDAAFGDVGASPGRSAGCYSAIPGGTAIYSSGTLPGAYGDSIDSLYDINFVARNVGVGGTTRRNGYSGGAVVVYLPVAAYWKDGLNWRPVSEISVKQSGTWASVDTLYIKRDGVWQPTYNGTWQAKAANGRITVDYRPKKTLVYTPPVNYNYSSNGDSTYGSTSGCGFDSRSDSGSCSPGSKIVCTAMNESYGFGSFRNKIWLAYADKYLTKEHEVGYHTIFKPLVDFAYYKQNNKANIVVRKMLEHIARHRSIDLRAEMKASKRHTLGRVYRFILEPICYVVGKIKRVRDDS